LRLKTMWMVATVAPPAALNILANFVLLPRFGVIAAGWTSVAGYAAAIALSVGLGRQHFRIPFPRGDLMRALAACLPLAAFLQLPFPAGAAGLALMLAGSGLVYGAGAVAVDLCGIRAALLAARRSEAFRLAKDRAS
jgi:O-antigen/teichoic acid export membrane protein